MRRLDIGVASYGNPDKLRITLNTLIANTRSDFEILVIHNPGEGAEDEEAWRVLCNYSAIDGRVIPVLMEHNVGYVGAVNYLLKNADTNLIAYVDNDVEIQTPGWDDQLCELLEQNPEVGWAFPGTGHYGFNNGRYHECLWNAGYCWILRREAAGKIAQERQAADGSGGFDPTLGHHEEVDYMIRMRLAGYRIGCCPGVEVAHHESATRSPESAQRIHDGVVRWMNKWNGYFCGDDLKYSMTAYDARALRYTDWNVDALYMERMTLRYFPHWNAAPEIVHVPGVGEMEAVKVLKPKGCYGGRAI